MAASHVPRMKPQFSSESLRPVGGEVAEPLPFVGPTTLYVILTFVTFQLAHLGQTIEALSLFFHFVLNFSCFFFVRLSHPCDSVLPCWKLLFECVSATSVAAGYPLFLFNQIWDWASLVPHASTFPSKDKRCSLHCCVKAASLEVITAFRAVTQIQIFWKANGVKGGSIQPHPSFTQIHSQ